MSTGNMILINPTISMTDLLIQYKSLGPKSGLLFLLAKIKKNEISIVKEK